MYVKYEGILRFQEIKFNGEFVIFLQFFNRNENFDIKKRLDSPYKKIKKILDVFKEKIYRFSNSICECFNMDNARS